MSSRKQVQVAFFLKHQYPQVTAGHLRAVVVLLCVPPPRISGSSDHRGTGAHMGSPVPQVFAHTVPFALRTRRPHSLSHLTRVASSAKPPLTSSRQR